MAPRAQRFLKQCFIFHCCTVLFVPSAQADVMCTASLRDRVPALITRGLVYMCSLQLSQADHIGGHCLQAAMFVVCSFVQHIGLSSNLQGTITSVGEVHQIS